MPDANRHRVLVISGNTEVRNELVTLLSGYGYFVGPEKEQGAVGCAATGGDFGDELGGDAVDRTHQRAEGIVDDLAAGLLRLLIELVTSGLGNLAGDNLGGAFFLCCLLLALLLVALDSF